MGKITKVTIVTGFYNREDYVDESIQSLVNQNYENYDIVIFDDASTDRTFERLKKFEESHNNIKLIRHSRNKGFVQGLIDVISGIDSEYIAIHGSGDISTQQRIQEQAKYLDSNPNVGVVASRSTTKNSNKSQNYTSIKTITTRELLMSNPVNHGASMFRFETYLQVGGYRNYFTFAQDYDLWLRMSLFTEVHILPQIHYIRESPKNTVSRDINKIIIQLMLSSYSSQLIEMRREKGYDLVDKFGQHASLFYNPKKRTTSINKLMMLQFIQEKKANMEYLSEVSKSVNNSYRNRMFLSIIKFGYENPFLRRIIANLMNLRLNGRDVKDFQPVAP